MLSQSVLVLNQNYEAISICSAKKAVVLLFLDKAQMVESYDLQIHSVSVEIPYPSVIRLNRYVKKPYQKVTLSRSNIIKRDKHTCLYCGKNHQPMTIDHVIPKSLGGKDTWENLVCACLKCNGKKGDKTPDQAGMKLIKRPLKPTHLFYLQHLAGNAHNTWHNYLFLN